MKKTKVYISGKISGDSNYRFKFACAKAYLKELGYKVVSPVSYFDDDTKSWEFYMKRSIKRMMACDCIYMIPDWGFSKGAQIEYKLALNLNMDIIQGEWENLNEFGYIET